MPKINLKTLFIILTILFILLSLFILSMFVARPEITYNCNGYKIYKMVTPLPSAVVLYSIDKQSNTDGYSVLNNSLIFYTPDEEPLQIKFNQDIKKIIDCKDFNFSAIHSMSRAGGVDNCYLLNRNKLTDYPECSKEIKAEFGVV